ncbi:MAG: hypothetical protein KF830_16540 [Planctomycetes bacterium]|nr:hypothetical protein [Planctomycetota bacterium]
MRVHALVLGCLPWLAGCGDRALLQDESGRYRLLARAGDQQDEHVLRLLRGQHGPVVFAHDPPSAVRALSLLRPAQGVRDGRLVAIDDEPAATSPGDVPVATVVPDRGSAVAVDMALLWCHGVTPPPRLMLGSRIVLPGGATQRQPAPGDFVVELLRRQHAELLTDRPRTDVVFRIGLLLVRDDDRQRRLGDDVEAAVARYPHLVCERRQALGDTARLATMARERLDAGCRALLVAGDGGDALAAVAAMADEFRAALIVLDPDAECRQATCCIGADPTMLGRAAAEAVRRLAPDGAALLELATDHGTPAADGRHQGFAAALGLRPLR